MNAGAVLQVSGSRALDAEPVVPLGAEEISNSLGDLDALAVLKGVALVARKTSTIVGVESSAEGIRLHANATFKVGSSRASQTNSLYPPGAKEVGRSSLGNIRSTDALTIVE